MSLERDDNVDIADASVVRLAGRDFYVLPLSLRQIIAIADHVPKITGITAETMSSDRLMPLAEVMWQGLHRAHPKMSRDEFLDLPVTLNELIEALPAVLEKAGGRKADAEAGESRAASGSTNSTGTSSSPTS